MLDRLFDVLIISLISKIKSYKSLIISFSVFIILLAGIFLRSKNEKDRSEIRTKQELKEIKIGIKSFQKRTGRLPINLKEVLGNNPLNIHLLKDEWGRPYFYEILDTPASHLKITSFGQDGLKNTEDDIQLLYKSK